ncbi:hypothetical protein KTD27_26595 [Burkholderia multivorans]|nr:hypothetical protein [Burkholderia multivorans]
MIFLKNCSPGEHRTLQDEVDQACKGGKRSCAANMDNAIILMTRQRNVQCAMARDLMNGKCFAGRGRLIETRRGLRECG